MEMIVSIPVSDCSLWYDCSFVDTKLIRSIKRSGVLSPAIVRQSGNGYQVCIGVKRVKAAEIAGYDCIPAIVQSLSDKEVMLLRIEDNISRVIQRSMPSTELAKLVAVYYSALKEETNIIVKADSIAETIGDRTVYKAKSNIGRVSEVFGISEREVSRYMRISMLVDLLEPLVNSKRVSERTAVELSYLPTGTQSSVARVLLENRELNLSVAKVKVLRARQEFWDLSVEEVEQILREDNCSFQFPPMEKLIRKYKLMNMTSQEIETLVDKALERYFQ